MDEFDYIVVGSGSAGRTVAARLSEDPNTTFACSRRGGRDWNPFIHIPAGFMKTLVDPSVNWLYESEASEGTAGRRIHAPRGKTLGGLLRSTAIFTVETTGFRRLGTAATGDGAMRTSCLTSDDQNGVSATATIPSGDVTATSSLPISTIATPWPTISSREQQWNPIERGLQRCHSGRDASQRTIFKGRRVSRRRPLRPALKRPNIDFGRNHTQRKSFSTENVQWVSVQPRWTIL